MTDSDTVIATALAARKLAYAPYSKFKVGAAIESVNGRVFSGCNVENASLGLCICAERTAVCAAIVAGETRFQRIVIASLGRAMPCGACRQFLAEFTPDLEVVCVEASDISNRQTLSLSELLPHQFRLDV